MYSSETTDEELEAVKAELAEADMLCLGGDSLVDTRLLVRLPITTAGSRTGRSASRIMLCVRIFRAIART